MALSGSRARATGTPALLQIDSEVPTVNACHVTVCHGASGTVCARTSELRAIMIAQLASARLAA
eukprot:1533103-Rhodomonas_salina.3